MKNKLIKIGLASVSGAAMLGAVGCFIAQKNIANNAFKTEGAYKLMLQDAGTAALSNIAFMESVDGENLLFATGFDDATLNYTNQRAQALKEEASLGYVINELPISSREYYSGITTKNELEVQTTWVATDIFGVTDKTHLIVEEIDRNNVDRFSVTAFIKVGEEVVVQKEQTFDLSEYWEFETLCTNWSYEGEIAPLTNQPQGYLVEAVNASTTISNYAKIPDGATHFKFSLLWFGGYASKVTVFLNDTLVRAVGATEDYVTNAAHNSGDVFAYPLGSLKGNVSIKIQVESGTPGSICTAFFQSMGFSEFGVETDHVSNLTKWTKGRMFVDWTKVGSFAGNTITGYGQGCYHLFVGGGFQNTLHITEETKYLVAIAGAELTVTANGNAVTCVRSVAADYKYYYDLSAYVGQDVVVQMIGNDFAFAQAELVADYRDLDTSEYWEFETLCSNWSYEGEIAPLTNQPQGYLVEAANASTTISNYAKIPDGATHFKFSLLWFGGYASKVTVFLNDTLVRAVGATEDYVTNAAHNSGDVFAYPLGALTGNISIKIQVESGTPGNICTAFFQSMGFSEFGVETNHVSNLTKWTKGRMFVDWTKVGSFAGNTITGYGQGCYHLFVGGGFQNTLHITEETKYLVAIAGAELTVTANGTAVTCVSSGVTANKYVYDLSAYVGQDVVVQMIGNDFAFAQAELVAAY